MKTQPRIVVAFALAFACVLAGCNGGVEQTSSGVTEGGGCHVGGCSNELCSDKTGVGSQCIYRRKFACYTSAICEPQPNGVCAWTPTPELTRCLANGGPLPAP
jgi:hypothetical protein